MALATPVSIRKADFLNYIDFEKMEYDLKREEWENELKATLDEAKKTKLIDEDKFGEMVEQRKLQRKKNG